jgi:hypothetical protein
MDGGPRISCQGPHGLEGDALFNAPGSRDGHQIGDMAVSVDAENDVFSFFPDDANALSKCWKARAGLIRILKYR